MSYVRRVYDIPGTGFGRLVKPDKDRIWEAFKVSASLRKRNSWDACK